MQLGSQLVRGNGVRMAQTPQLFRKTLVLKVLSTSQGWIAVWSNLQKSAIFLCTSHHPYHPTPTSAAPICR